MNLASPNRLALRRAHFLLLAFFFTTLLLGILADNRWIFGPAITEDGDFAANSLLVTEAKHLSLVTGNYSKFHFNHPGPFYLYVQAAGEVIFHDLLGITKSPYQAQLLAIIVLNAASYTIALYLLFIAAGWRSLTPLLLGWSAFLATAHSATPAPILGWASISSTWMPCMYVASFALFLTSAFSFARGISWSMPFLLFSGGALVHGHVSFAAIIPALAGYAMFERFLHTRAAQTPLVPARREILTSLFILLLFLAPIAYHTLAHYPGEFGRYLSYKAPEIPERGLIGAFRFALRFLGWKSLFFGAILMTAAIALRATWQKGDNLASWLRILFAAFFIALLYAWKSIDSYADDYTLQYLSVVPMFLVASIVARIADRTTSEVSWSTWALAIPVALLFASLVNPYRGSEEVAAGTQQLRAMSKTVGTGKVIGLDFEPQDWPYAIGLLATAKREHLPVCSSNPEWSFIATIAMTCQHQPDSVAVVAIASGGQRTLVEKESHK